MAYNGRGSVKLSEIGLGTLRNSLNLLNMKIVNLAIWILSAFALVSCNKDDAEPQGKELTLLPTEAQTNTTRASSSSFFTAGDQITLAINDRGSTTNYIYQYSNGVFSGISTPNTYRFFLDDQVITSITTSWPTIRPTAWITDQRKDIDFKTCDYMTATLTNVMPTKESVPIEFVHENSKVVFVLFGQNAAGLKIESLVVDIDNVGYWAHIDPISGNAELILKPGNVALDANEIAGRIKVAGITGSVVFQSSLNYTLLANTSYVVSLTPRGDNVYASVSIGGWYQNENGVAVPLMKENGYYMIHTEAQLFAVAQLINNYKPDAAGVDWTTSNYKLAADIVRSQPLREWFPVSNFTGEFNLDTYTITPEIIFSNNNAPIIF